MIRLFLLASILLILNGISQAQNLRVYGEFAQGANKKEEKKILKRARYHFDRGEYTQAMERYNELLKRDATNPMYNYEMAECFYFNFRQPAAIPFFEKSIQFSKDTMGEAYYYLALSQHLDARYEDAQKNYNSYLRMIRFFGTDLPQEEEEKLIADIQHRIELCENGKQLSGKMADRIFFNGAWRSFRIESVGDSINSEYDDYDAVLSNNDSLMYYTTRREGTVGGRVDWDDKYFEDIFWATSSFNGWGKGRGIGEPVNTKKHEAIIGVSPDNKQIYFYRGVKQGTFYSSELKNGVWSEPRILYEESDVNTSDWETSMYGFTVSGSELYVVSDREGSLGGRDIFISKKQASGQWGPLTNLGPQINTVYDEDAPFVSADGKTLYFSSNGHNSIGGFDIFRSSRDADQWSKPVNMGPPFSTPGEDIYFILANRLDKAYFSSSAYAVDGTRDLDIYKVDICEDQPVITLAGRSVGLKGADLQVVAKDRDTTALKIESEQFVLKLDAGRRYDFIFKTDGIESVIAGFEMPALCHSAEMYQEIYFEGAGKDMVFRNAFFDIRKMAGNVPFNEYLSAADRSKLSGYSEHKFPTTPVVLAAVTTPTVAATPTTVATTTVSTASKDTVAVAPLPLLSIGNQMFDYDQAGLKDEFKSELDKLADYLLNINKKAKIEISGHTDSKGSEDYNLHLSKQRAEAIVSYLASKGVSRSRLRAVGYGEGQPVAPNEKPDGTDDPEGRAKNRRTEIRFM